MNQPAVRVYPTRWVVLLAFMLAVAFNQLLWITFAPITGNAAAYYGVDDLSIGLLSMSFMIAYLFVSIPASWVIDTYGFRVAVAIGAGLTGIFGMMRGLVASDYNLVLVAQLGMESGPRPFVVVPGPRSKRPGSPFQTPTPYSTPSATMPKIEAPTRSLGKRS